LMILLALMAATTTTTTTAAPAPQQYDMRPGSFAMGRGGEVYEEDEVETTTPYYTRRYS
jgi:hypothetical protein